MDGEIRAALEPREFKQVGFSASALDEAAIVATTDTRGRIVYVNDKFCKISGYSRNELIGSNHRILRSGLHDKAFFQKMYRTIARGQTWHGELCNRAKDGGLYWVDTTIVPRCDAIGRVTFYDAIRFDITPLKQAEERLWTEAHTDTLTGLANRALFMQRLTQETSEGTASGQRFALAMLDLDDFKDINDSFGHDVGDILLRTIADRLTALLGDGALIARLGGDEFTFITPMQDRCGNSVEIFERIAAVVREPVRFPEFERRCTVSMGVAIFPDHGTTPGTLLKHADIALYNAKAAGRDNCRLFKQAMADLVMQKSELRLRAQSALANKDFKLYYQPFIDLRTKKVIGFEALLRWEHGQGEALSPASFWDLFNDPEMSSDIGEFVLDEIVSQASQWQKQGVAFGRLAFNVTAADFRTENAAEMIIRKIRNAGLFPAQFRVEVTEGLFIGRGATRIHMVLEKLHAAGIRIALDDFGTGFASLTHLKTLPIDRLKIDQNFVHGLLTDKASEAIIDGIIRIAHSLELQVTAEGVETREQLDLLTQMGCDHAQGYLFAKPMPAQDVPGFIEGAQI